MGGRGRKRMRRGGEGSKNLGGRKGVEGGGVQKWRRRGRREEDKDEREEEEAK